MDTILTCTVHAGIITKVKHPSIAKRLGVLARTSIKDSPIPEKGVAPDCGGPLPLPLCRHPQLKVGVFGEPNFFVMRM